MAAGEHVVKRKRGRPRKAQRACVNTTRTIALTTAEDDRFCRDATLAGVSVSTHLRRKLGLRDPENL